MKTVYAAVVGLALAILAACNDEALSENSSGGNHNSAGAPSTAGRPSGEPSAQGGTPGAGPEGGVSAGSGGRAEAPPAAGTSGAAGSGPEGGVSAGSSGRAEAPPAAGTSGAGGAHGDTRAIELPENCANDEAVAYQLADSCTMELECSGDRVLGLCQFYGPNEFTCLCETPTSYQDVWLVGLSSVVDACSIVAAVCFGGSSTGVESDKPAECTREYHYLESTASNCDQLCTRSAELESGVLVETEAHVRVFCGLDDDAWGCACDWEAPSPDIQFPATTQPDIACSKALDTCTEYNAAIEAAR